MRIRRKPWAYPELCASPLFVREPQNVIGNWREAFPAAQPLALELGCGKGAFAAAYAVARPEMNLIAVDIKSEVLVMAKRKLEAAYKEAGTEQTNALLMSFDIERIRLMLDSRDTIEEIYINFPNPWPKNQHKKKRLTHPRQLEQYRAFLRDGGALNFKTDDDELFEDTKKYLLSCGFELAAVSEDIYADGLADSLIATEHEKQFVELGKKIKYVRATKLPAQDRAEA